MPMRGAALGLCAAALLVGPVVGQDSADSNLFGTPVNPVQGAASPIVTLDRERLFAGSQFGQRLTSEIEAASRELAAENRRIEGELIEEERALTDQRATLTPEEFRPLADAFDKKVEAIRDEQDGKSRELNRRLEEERQTFFRAALPVLGALVRDSGAVAILNAEAVFLSFQQLDITDRAIARIDEVLGDGTQSTMPGPQPGASDGTATGGSSGAP